MPAFLFQAAELPCCNPSEFGCSATTTSERVALRQSELLISATADLVLSGRQHDSRKIVTYDRRLERFCSTLLGESYATQKAILIAALLNGDAASAIMLHSAELTGNLMTHLKHARGRSE